MKTAAIAGLLALISLASAQESGLPISTDRPSFSDGTLIIPKGRWQIEGGYTYYRVGSSTLETFGELLLRFPVHPRLELRVLNVTIGRPSGGLLDPGVGFKYRLQEGTASRPDLAFVLQSTVPAGGRSFRVDRWQPTAKLAWYQQSSETTGFGGNLLVSDLGPNGSRFTQYGVSLYLSKTLTTTTGAFAEIYGLAPLSNGGPNGGFFDIGATHLLNPKTQVDFRFGTGFDQRRDGWFLGAGVSYRF